MSDSTKAPIVFVCHASEDKARFVTEFGKKLRANGIDAWVDQWEIFPGDSLVRKIFPAIEQSEAIIIVLSHNSIDKPWVKKELDISVIRQIQGKSKLIPVLIDKVTVPTCLIDTLWVNIENDQDYDNEINRIIMSIFNQTDKPPLGSPPAYVQADIEPVNGLTKTDTIVLKACGDCVIEAKQYFINPAAILEKVSLFDISQDQCIESLQILEGESYVELSWGTQRHLITCKVTDYGFEEYLDYFIQDYDSIKKSVYSRIANDTCKNIAGLVDSTGHDVTIISHILDDLVAQDLITGAKTCGGYHIVIVSPKLKRIVDSF